MKIAACFSLILALAAGSWSQDKPCEWQATRGLVGFEDAVYLRGESALSGTTAVVSLPSGFETFTKTAGRTVQVTCIDGYSPLSVSRVVNGQFTVSTNSQGRASQAFFWEVKAACASTPFLNNAAGK